MHQMVQLGEFCLKFSMEKSIQLLTVVEHKPSVNGIIPQQKNNFRLLFMLFNSLIVICIKRFCFELIALLCDSYRIPRMCLVSAHGG